VTHPPHQQAGQQAQQAQQQLQYDATEEVARVIGQMGRTEDVALSPDRSRLALAGFNADQLTIFGIALHSRGASPRIALEGCAVVSSPMLARPHGVSFIDDSTLIVANRQGGVSIFGMPTLGEAAEIHQLEPLATLEDRFLRKLEMPGSLFVVPGLPGVFQLLVCSNYSNRITRHQIDMRKRVRIGGYRVVATKDLATPDGVAVSSDKRWIAVSNHISHEVFLYDAKRWLGGLTAPDARLGGVAYPHGLRFTRDGGFLLVADAGSKLLHVFAAGSPPWSETRMPVRSLELMDEETYQRARSNPLEGGIKGIDIDDEAGVLITTCEEQPLAFFDLKELLG
jgi:hypothetical protein